MIKLRSFTKDDTAMLAGWLHQEHVLKWYHDPDEWLNEVKSEDFSWVTHLIAEQDGVPIGFCQYYDYALGGESWHGGYDTGGAYSIDYLIGEREYLKRGLGRDIAAAVSAEVFLKTGAKSIIVQPESGNTASRKTLLSAGYSYDDINDIFIMKR